MADNSLRSEYLQDLCRRLVGRFKGINYLDLTEYLAMLEIFSEQRLALTRLRGRDDECVPPRNGIAFLQKPGPFHGGKSGGYRLPYYKVTDDLLCPGRGDTGFKFARER